jgi:hypothetical protein
MMPVAAPVFKLAGGTYNSTQQVEITCATTGAMIYYTTDGSIPAKDSLKYTGPVEVAKNLTIKAIAIKDGMNDSPVSEAAYVILIPVAAPVFKPSGGTIYTATQEIEIVTETTGATIYYTLDGTAPTKTSLKYEKPVTVSKTTTIKAFAVKNSMKDSEIIEANYRIYPPVSDPTLSIASGTYSNTLEVAISTTTPGAKIYYTLDGVTPTVNTGILYTSSVSILKPVTIKTIAVLEEMTDSNIIEAAYIVPTETVANPVISPNGGNFYYSTNITITCATDSSEVYYTTDGSVPSKLSTKYTAPFNFNKYGSTTIKAIAYKTGMFDSQPAASNIFNIIYLPPNPNLTSITVNNAPKQGELLTATPAYSNGAGTVTYLWKRSSDASGNTVTNSNLGTTDTYTLVAGDVGNYVFCVATASGSTTGGSKTSSVIGPVTPAVLLESGSVAGITADDTKITGLTSGKVYVVKTGVNYYGVLANGTLFSTLRATAALAHADAAALTGTQITNLTNGTTYKVTEEALVSLESGSLGTEGDTKITGLTSGKIYVIKIGVNYYGVLADGTFFNTSRTSAALAHADAVAFTGTEITGLTNGTAYKVTEEALVSLESGSLGTAGDTKITGLTATNKYVVITGGKTYGVTAGGTLGTENADAAALNAGVTEITGLTNGTVYKVSDVTSLVLLETGSLGTAGDTKITGLTSGNKYVVITGGKTYGVTAGGTLGAENADAASLTGTEITGLTNGTVYKAVDVTNLVLLETGSLGTAGNASITGLTSGREYYVISGGTSNSVMANGTFGPLGFLTGTSITGLTNGKTYKVIYSTTTVDSITYTYNGSVMAVTGSSAIGTATILDNVSGIPVTSIGDNAFNDRTGLSSITIPNSVTSIGNYAFQGCTGLTSVSIGTGVTSIAGSAFQSCNSLTAITVDSNNTNYSSASGVLYNKNQTILILYPAGKSGAFTIPDSVTSIGNYLFKGCTGLTSVSIGTGVTTIGSYAFQGCTNLASVSIGTGVTSIGSYAFQSCSSLTAITVDLANLNFSSNEGVLYNKNQTILKLYPVGKSGAFTIPDSVTSIESYAFKGCTGPTSVSIGTGLTSIGASAFEGFTGLTSITIPNSITSIGNYAFKGCTGLTSITIPNSVTSIGDYAFEGCTGLSSVSIGTGVTSIGNSAFYGCTGLAGITLPGGVTSIGTDAFLTCSGLTAITVDAANPNYSSNAGVLYNKDQTILKFYPGGKSGAFTVPNSVTRIENFSVQYCTGLTDITIPEGVTSIGNSAFNASTGLTSITIPNSVTSIEPYAFYNCGGLTSVSIGTGVTSIGNYAFKGCSNLTQANFLGNAPAPFGAFVFSACAAGFKIHYLSTQTGWTTPTWNGYSTIFN